MDEMDRAQALDEMHREAALAHFSGGRPPRPPVLAAASGGRDCRRCGDPIAEARLKSRPDAVRCVACETAYERSQRERVR